MAWGCDDLLRGWAAAALLLLTACGGGGGGGGTGAVTPSTPAPTTPVVVPVGPSATSAEFLRNPGIAAIHADAAYNQGASGRGVVVGVLDSGVDATGPDLAGRVSAQSTDIVASRNQLVGSDRHGTYVAGIIASNFNGQGTVGVAFESTILSIRADSAAALNCDSSTCFGSNDLARGIDYAVANGARVINMSFGSDTPDGATFEAALQRAINAGVVIAAAGGNAGSAASHYPSSYGVDPRFAGAVIGVGSLNTAGAASTFSNTAGAAATAFLFAPGEGVISDCTATGCWNLAGTSFAAPHVAGALALVLQAFPNLTGRQAVDLLLRTARDLGATGVDPVYGMGALDLQRAFAPVGTLSVPTGGGVVSASTVAGLATAMGEAFGDAVRNSGALRTVGWDFYQRPFQTDLGAAYAGPRPGLLAPVSADRRRRSQLHMALAGDARLNLAASQVDDGEAPGVAARFPWMPVESGRDVTLALTAGRLGLTAWSGQASANPFTVAAPDPYTALARSDHALRADYAVGGWRLSAEAGSGDARSPDLLRREPGASYLRAIGRTRLRSVDSTFSFGRLDEPMGPLGAYLPPQTGLALPSRTAFAAWSGILPLGEDFTLSAEASVGRTRLTGRFLSLEKAAWSTAWRVSLYSDCRALRLACGSLRLSVAQPLRIEDGRFLARLPVAPSDYFGPTVFTDRRFSASPSGREMDVTLSALQRTLFEGQLQVDGVMALDAGHRADAQTGLGVLTTWRKEF